MTINEFISNYNIKNKRIVLDWIKKDLIPLADVEKDYIPDSARPPYTRARARNSKSIYISIVKASYNRRHVMPQLYKICEDEFRGYISRLIQAGIIEARISDGIEYYDATLTVNNIKRNYILKAIEAVSAGVSEGTTKAILSS